jgi:formate dehydrogenase maturation protein FdhE
MDIVARIRKQGFRKWYERQLIDSHLSFVTCFLSAIAVAACLSELQVLDPGWRSAALLAAVFAATLLGWYSWRRYITILARAETYGNRSCCPTCKAYARFEILATGQAGEGPYLDPLAHRLPHPWLRVRCRKCGTAWRMPD